MQKLGFIGTGSMARALVQAAAAGGHGESCVLANRTPEKAQRLAEEVSGHWVKTNAEAAKAAEFLFLGVKPYQMAHVLQEISPVLDERRAAGDDVVLVSMAAGVTIKNLQDMAGGAYPVIRILPNTPCAIGKGMVLMALSENVTDEQRDAFCRVMEQAGRFDEADETMMDAGGVVAGCTPAWAYLFIEGLADGAVEAGLPRQKAMEYAAQAVLGAAAMCLTDSAHPGPLKDAVCSPGGSTIAGVHALERAGVRGAAMDAVTAAFEKTKQMAKG